MLLKKVSLRRLSRCLFVILILLCANFVFATIEGDTQASPPNVVKNIHGWARNYRWRNIAAWTVGVIAAIGLAILLWPEEGVAAIAAGTTSTGGAILRGAGTALRVLARFLWAPIRLLWTTRFVPLWARLAGTAVVSGGYYYLYYRISRSLGGSGAPAGTGVPAVHTKDYILLCPGTVPGTQPIGVSSAYRIHTENLAIPSVKNGNKGSVTIIVDEARQWDGKKMKDLTPLQPRTAGGNSINFNIVSRGSLGMVNIDSAEKHVIQYRSRYNGYVTLELYLSRGKAGGFRMDDLEIDPKTTFTGGFDCGPPSPDALAEAKRILDEMKGGSGGGGGTGGGSGGTPSPAPAPTPSPSPSPSPGTAPSPAGSGDFKIYMQVPVPNGKAVVPPVRVFKVNGSDFIEMAGLTEQELDASRNVIRTQDKKVTSIYWHSYLATMSTGIFLVIPLYSDGSGYTCKYECASAGGGKGVCYAVGSCVPGSVK